jgi:hypothetical protein
MEYQINFDSETPYLQITLLGIFNMTDLESCYKEFLQNPNWKCGTDILWDCTKCDLEHLSSNDMKGIGLMTEKYKERRGPGKAAWVVGKEVDFGLARMFEIINEGKVIFNFRVFRTIEKGRNWVE